MENIITSKDNPTVKLYQKLSNSKKERLQYGLFVLEGQRIVKDALDADAVHFLMFTEKAFDEYLSSGAKANGMAQAIKQRFQAHGCGLLADTLANQVFPIVPDSVCEKLGKTYRFSVWEKVDETHTAVRFCTNVTTKREEVDALLADIEKAFA